MTMSGAVARPLLAGIFIYGGIDSLRHPETKVKAADEVAPLIVSALGLPATDTEVLVRANGAIQVAAGIMLGVGKFRRLAAGALAASLIPTTYAGHRFWEEVDEDRRAQQRIHFLKNAAILGGLVLAAGDTGGRASLPWRASRATKRALSSGRAAQGHLQAGAGEAADQARRLANSLAEGRAGDLAGQARQVARSARDSEVTKRAVKAARRAASDTRSELPALAQLSRRTLKSARKAANRALEEAVSAARQSELSTAAFRAVRQAGTEAVRVLDEAAVGRRTASAAAGIGRGAAAAAADLAGSARDRLAEAA